MSLLLLIIFYVLWSIINLAIAEAKGQSPAGVFFASLILSPLLIWLFLVATPSPYAVKRQKRIIELLEAAAQPDGVTPAPQPKPQQQPQTVQRQPRSNPLFGAK